MKTTFKEVIIHFWYAVLALGIVGVIAYITRNTAHSIFEALMYYAIGATVTTYIRLVRAENKKSKNSNK